MQFEEFLAQYRQAHQDWGFGLADTAAAAAEIARLRALVPSVQPADKQDAAGRVLADFETEISPEAQERMARAVTAIADGGGAGGTVAERIARAEAGIVAVSRIADESGDPGERYAILAMNETLADLVEDLRDSLETDGR